MLMDEPLSALDSQTRELLMDDLVDLWGARGFTACYITHNLAEAVRLGHRHRRAVAAARPDPRVIEIDTPMEERTVSTRASPRSSRISGR
jgi:NitT/TauT family transport system ATP-binding protein